MLQRVVIGIFVTSFAGGLGALLLGEAVWAKYIAFPALFLSGWAALGHLITLDDDAPGGWSNLEESKTIWRYSLLEMAGKFILFAAVGISIYA